VNAQWVSQKNKKERLKLADQRLGGKEILKYISLSPVSQVKLECTVDRGMLLLDCQIYLFQSPQTVLPYTDRPPPE